MLDFRIRNFTKDTLNTHSMHIMKSVGKIILSLRKKFYPRVLLQIQQTLEEKDSEKAKQVLIQKVFADIQKEYSHYISDSNEISDIKTKQLKKLKEFLDKMQSTEYHRSCIFFIYDQKEKEEIKYIINSDEILTLVWLAIRDKDAYEEKDRSEEAQKDRVNILFDCLEKIVATAICAKGIQHALILILNKIYPNADIIQHFPSYLVKLTKTFLGQTLIDSKLKEKEKFTIFKGWSNYYCKLSEDLPEEYKNFLETHKVEWKSYLIDKLENQGINAASKMDLNDYFYEILRLAQPPIEIHHFARDFIDLLSLLVELSSEMQKQRDEKDELKTQFNNVKNKVICQFLPQCSSFEDFEKLGLPEFFRNMKLIRPLIEANQLVGNIKFESEEKELENLTLSLKKELIKYFENFLSLTYNENKDYSQKGITEEKFNRFHFLLEKTKSFYSIKKFIENFFKDWITAVETENFENGRHLLSRIQFSLRRLSSLEDEELSKLFVPNDESKIVLDSYKINRILLQAILTPPSLWSDYFYEWIKRITIFIKKDFNSEVKSEKKAEKLYIKEKSQLAYPDYLLYHFDFLIELRLKRATLVQQSVIEATRILIPLDCRIVKSKAQIFYILSKLPNVELRKKFFELIDEKFKKESDIIRLLEEYAAKYGNTKCINSLLSCLTEEYQFKLLEQKDKDGMTPLMISAKHGNAEFAKAILELIKEEDKKFKLLEQEDKDCMTPLMIAIKYGNVEYIKAILEFAKEKDKKIRLLEQKDKRKRTLLMLAAEYGNAGCIKFLLDCLSEEHKFKLLEQQKDNDGRTPLMLAAEYGNAECIRFLLDGLSEEHKFKLLGQKDKIGCALNLICGQRHLEEIKHIQNTASVDLKLEREKVRCRYTDKEGRIITEWSDLKELKKSILFNKLTEDILNEIFVILKTKSGIIDGYYELGKEKVSIIVKHTTSYREYASKGDRTPLMIAIEQGNVECIKAILAFVKEEDKKIRLLEQKNKKDETPLMLAAKHRKVECIKLLLYSLTEERKCELMEQKNKYGETPLMYAAKQRDAEFFTAFLEIVKKENKKFKFLEQENAEGRTILMYLLMHNVKFNESIMVFLRYLIKENQIKLLEHKDKDGMTLLMYAVKYYRPEAVKMLLEIVESKDQKLKQLKQKDRYGITSLMYVAQWGDIKFIQEFLSDLTEEHLFELLEQKDNDGWTPLMNAVKNMNVDFLQVILDNLTEEQHLFEFLKQEYENGKVPLIEIAKNNLTEFIQKLLDKLTEEHQFELLAQKDKVCALNLICGQRHLEEIKHVQNMASVDLKLERKEKLKREKVRCRYTDKEGRIMEKWKDFESPDSQIMQKILYILKNNNGTINGYDELTREEVIKIIDFAKSYRGYIQDQEGKTLLTYFAQNGQIESINGFLKNLKEEYKFELLKQKDENGETPLMSVIHSGNIELINEFLRVLRNLKEEHKFELLKQKDEDGKTPLMSVVYSVKIESSKFECFISLLDGLTEEHQIKLLKQKHNNDPMLYELLKRDLEIKQNLGFVIEDNMLLSLMSKCQNANEKVSLRAVEDNQIIVKTKRRRKTVAERTEKTEKRKRKKMTAERTEKTEKRKKTVAERTEKKKRRKKTVAERTEKTEKRKKMVAERFFRIEGNGSPVFGYKKIITPVMPLNPLKSILHKV